MSILVDRLNAAHARIAELERELAAAREPLTPAQQHAEELRDALKFYRDECSGAEPSMSIFHIRLVEVLAKVEAASPKGGAA